MEGAVKKEIIYDLTRSLEILSLKQFSELEPLSDHAIEDVAVHKDLDLISVTVLIYSLYKVQRCLQQKDMQNIITELKRARDSLQRDILGQYNKSIRTLFMLVRKCNAKVKEHMQDVMDAARIKKGTVLLQKGLSIGQAAGLMGLSNWDLQAYAGKTTVLTQHDENMPATKRMKIALQLFT